MTRIFFRPLHVEHVDEWSLLIRKYLGLAPGWEIPSRGRIGGCLVRRIFAEYLMGDERQDKTNRCSGNQALETYGSSIFGVQTSISASLSIAASAQLLRRAINRATFLVACFGASK